MEILNHMDEQPNPLPVVVSGQWAVGSGQWAVGSYSRPNIRHSCEACPRTGGEQESSKTIPLNRGTFYSRGGYFDKALTKKVRVIMQRSQAIIQK